MLPVILFVRASHAMQVVLLAGGLGGARLAPALARVLGRGRLTVVANVGDDLEWMGLRVCPDLDSILYALAGAWDRDRGWGRRGETFRVREGLAALGAPAWFGVGDADLSLHLVRTRLLGSGASLTAVTRRLSRSIGVRGATVVPASDAWARTRFSTRDGRRLGFQEWYVRERARPRLRRTLLSHGAPSAAAVAAVHRADAVVLGPSNPVTSIGAILSLRGFAAAVRGVGLRVAISPVVTRRAASSPTVAHHARARRRVLEATGERDRAAAIATRYADLVDWFVLDEADEAEARAIRRLGLRVELADLLDEERLAETLLALLRRAKR
jgi:LPPG:FO 2-phospho-L-lactate transferase